MAITVTRGTLLESQSALNNLGKVYMIVEKDRYWFVKAMDKIKQAVKQQNKITQKYSNEKVHELGAAQPSGQFGIDPKNEEAMKQYQEAMEAFMEIPVTIETKQITLTSLKEVNASLTVDDQVALMWLFDES